ncbi:MAG: hypothetical protein J5691_01640 [Bacilli bacterium]|nr:hypothetical protein [Bacilli bacterium]
MDQDTEVALKAFIYTILTILVGYALLAVPYIRFLVEMIIVFVFLTTLFDLYSYMIIEMQKSKDTNKKKTKKSSKKKGK